MLTENEVQECISILRKKIDAINKRRNNSNGYYR